MRGSVAVVIVNYRTASLALAAARSLAGERAVLPGLRVVIVDGGSDDGSADRLITGAADPSLSDWVQVEPLAINGGFGWANNQAMLRLLQGDDPPDYIYLLNPDAAITPGAIVALAELLDQDARCAVAGSALRNEDGSAAGAQFRFITPGREFVRGLRTDALRRLLGLRSIMIEDAGEVDWVSGASMMLRAAAIRETGLFDTGFFLYFEEVELCWRLRRRGWRIRHAAHSVVQHFGGVATGVDYRHADAGTAPPLPRYWFASRRRLLALTLGSRGAILASLFWLAGHGLYVMRAAAGLGRRQRLNLHEARDMMRYGIVAKRADFVPHNTDCCALTGEAPAWIAESQGQ